MIPLFGTNFYISKLFIAVTKTADRNNLEEKMSFFNIMVLEIYSRVGQCRCSVHNVRQTSMVERQVAARKQKSEQNGLQAR